MIRIGIRSLLAAGLVLWGGHACGLFAQTKAENAGGPDFKEVYDLVRAHLAGMSEGQLNQAAVRGLVSALGPRVALVTNGAAAKAADELPLVSKSAVFGGTFFMCGLGAWAKDWQGQSAGPAASRRRRTN